MLAQHMVEAKVDANLALHCLLAFIGSHKLIQINWPDRKKVQNEDTDPTALVIISSQCSQDLAGSR